MCETVAKVDIAIRTRYNKSPSTSLFGSDTSFPSNETKFSEFEGFIQLGGNCPGAELDQLGVFVREQCASKCLAMAEDCKGFTLSNERMTDLQYLCLLKTAICKEPEASLSFTFHQKKEFAHLEKVATETGESMNRSKPISARTKQHAGPMGFLQMPLPPEGIVKVLPAGSRSRVLPH